jgi:hypothetical protein
MGSRHSDGAPREPMTQLTKARLLAKAVQSEERWKQYLQLLAREEGPDVE